MKKMKYDLFFPVSNYVARPWPSSWSPCSLYRLVSISTRIGAHHAYELDQEHAP